MNPENGLLYVLLFNNKLLEIHPKPGANYLLRNYGRNSRVLKISPTLVKPIAIDFHRGHLLIAGANTVCGFNAQQELKDELLQNGDTVTGSDFAIAHNENFDHNYLQIIKQAGKVCIIGNKAEPGMNYRNP